MTNMMTNFQIKAFYDERTSTMTYVVYDPETRDALVIDPVLDYEPVGSKLWTESVDRVLAFVAQESLSLGMILETHAHADHLSGAQRIKEQYPDAVLAVGERITVVQSMFKQIFALPEDFPTDGRQFDRLLEDGEQVSSGNLTFEVLFTPGHTPACACYRFGDAVFTGDALFMPDQGTGRCDFPAGSARDLYQSVTGRLYTLPEATRVFVGHDYQPGGRELRYETTIAAQKESNIQLSAATDKETFLAFREKRDSSLAAPKLLFQSIQVNVDAGHLPAASDNKKHYLKIPINVFRPEGEGALSLETV